MADRTEEALAMALGNIKRYHEIRFREFDWVFKSPIERIFYYGLFALEGVGIEDFIPTQQGLACRSDGGFPKIYAVDTPLNAAPEEFFGAPDVLMIWSQVQIGPYRADFVIGLRPSGNERFSSMTVVECDGHNYHERTKKQAAHDKKRDRYMAKMGVGVIRFTGSEIYADPKGCADQCLKILEEDSKRQVRTAAGAE